MAEKWIQQAEKSMERKGTVGAFTDWCKKRGYTETTLECIREAIKEAKRTGNLKLLRRAIFAKNMHQIARQRKRSFFSEYWGVDPEIFAKTHVEMLQYTI